jgi:hypothetical protein
MSADPATPQAESYVCHVFEADGLVAVSGANAGDPLALPGELCLGDVYRLSAQAPMRRLAIRDRGAGEGRFLGPSADHPEGDAAVAEGSEVGAAGTAVTLEARLTLMAPDGAQSDVVLIALAARRGDPRLVALPLAPVEPGVDYTLIAATERPGAVPLAETLSVAFARGTRITLADGTQRPIERLLPGDLLLTRDHGPQPVRQVLSRTVRALGSFAPVAIPKGTLGNADDLLVGQHQRLFLYQRGPDRIAGRAEILVRACDLVDGETVTLRKGGHADYLTLVLDRHEVIYAECIPAESLLVTAATRRQLPAEARARLDAEMPALSQDPLRAAEAPGAEMSAARTRLIRGLRGG